MTVVDGPPRTRRTPDEKRPAPGYATKQSLCWQNVKTNQDWSQQHEAWASNCSRLVADRTESAVAQTNSGQAKNRFTTGFVERNADWQTGNAWRGIPAHRALRSSRHAHVYAGLTRLRIRRTPVPPRDIPACSSWKNRTPKHLPGPPGNLPSQIFPSLSRLDKNQLSRGP